MRPMRSPHFLLCSMILMLGTLAGCGGGGGGGDDGGSVNPAPKFASTDDVAAAYRANELAILSEFFAYDISSPPLATTNAKSTSMTTTAPQPFRARPDRAGLATRNAGGISQKVLTSYDCSGSGTYTYDTDESTAYTSDGTETDLQCIEISTASDGTETSRSTYNGKIVTKCVDSQQAADTCASSDETYGAGTSAPFIYAYKEAAAGGEDTVEKDAVHRPYKTTATAATATADGSIGYLDNVTGATATFGFTRFVSTFDNATGSNLQTVSGTLTLDTNLAKCLSLPSIKMATAQAVQVDSNFQPTGGQLTLTDPSGQAAQVMFGSDGAATISVAGKSQTYTRAQLNGFCS